MKRPRKVQSMRRRAAKPAGRRRLWGWGLTVASFTVMGAFGYYFYDYLQTAKSFQVRTVTISGTEALDEHTVLVQSGITLDDNVLFIDTGAIEGRVEALPYVKTCRVSVTFPDTVNIDVEERPIHATLMINSRAYAIDPECVVLREYAVDEVPPEPYITNIRGLDFIAPGDQLDHPALTKALRVWEAYSTYASAEGVHVAELAAFNEMDIRMYCDELPYELRWGRGDLEAQARRLVVFWRQTNQGEPCSEYLDLRFGQDLACL